MQRAEPRVEAGKNRERSGRAQNKTAARSPGLWETRLKAAKRVVGGAFRILVYLGVAIAPLVLAWLGMEPGRGFLIDFSVALGFVGLSLMGLQFLLAARFRWVEAPFGMDVLLQYFRPGYEYYGNGLGRTDGRDAGPLALPARQQGAEQLAGPSARAAFSARSNG